jgi:two-component system, NarL family, response regulator DegU
MMTGRIAEERITVIIADDHPIVRAGLRMMIQKAPDIAVVLEAGNGSEALRAVEQFSPTVAVLDIEMPLMTGLDVLREIQKRKLATLPIVLTLYDERDVFDHAMTLGARGYILKDSAPDDIVRGIRRVAAGDYFLSPMVGAKSVSKKNHTKLDLLATLTNMEHLVLKLIADDRSTKDIADELFISPRTVDHHRASICSKLGISGSFALIRYAIEHRFLL